MKTYDFVISYADRCVNTARAVHEHLGVHGPTFLARSDNVPGCDWPLVYETAARSSWVTVAIICSHTIDAYHQRQEIDLAVSLRRAGGHTLVPVFLTCTDTEPAVPLGVRTLDRVDIGNGAPESITAKIDFLVGARDDIRSRTGLGWRTSDQPAEFAATRERLEAINEWYKAGILDTAVVHEIQLIVLKFGLLPPE